MIKENDVFTVQFISERDVNHHLKILPLRIPNHLFISPDGCEPGRVVCKIWCKYSFSISVAQKIPQLHQIQAKC